MFPRAVCALPAAFVTSTSNVRRAVVLFGEKRVDREISTAPDPVTVTPAVRLTLKEKE
jgi:hypothetical protein